MSGERITWVFLVAALGLAGCPSKGPDAAPVPPKPKPAPPVAPVDPDQPFPDDFPLGALQRAAQGCTASADCVAVSPGGGCWAVTRETLVGPFAKQYRAWIAAGLGGPSGSPPELPPIDAAQVPGACGEDWAGVACVSGRCELTPSDCEYGGMRRSQCIAQGGEWGGCVMGRGRLPGCNPKTKDAGKVCSDSKECEGACVKGSCTAYKNYKGCGVMRDGQMRCVD